MSVQDQTPRNSEINEDELEDEQRVIDSIINTAPPPLSNARIHKVPGGMVREKEDYEKYYVPKVVSIGPYHFDNQKLKSIEKIKPIFAMRLLSNEKETLRSLYKKLGEPETVQELRNSYEAKSTDKFCDKAFTKMMLLDGCFILYYILFIFGRKPETCRALLKSHQIVFVHQDLFLLENQIPFKVLREVMKLLNIDCSKITTFIYGNILASGTCKTSWLGSVLCTRSNESRQDESKRGLMNTDPDHILHLLHRSLTYKDQVPSKVSSPINNYRCTFRNVNDLVDVGIHFKPSETKSLAHIEFCKGCWWFSAAKVILPPITVDDSTKPMLLNLIAYEMWSHEAYDAGVTSYVCLLDTLIDNPEDVKVLRKAGVLENSLGSDKEVAKLFNEIGTDLVPNNLAYMEAKNMIQSHYVSWSNTLYSQLKHEYVKSPWAFLALLGAVMALLLSAVQAYFSVWSPKSDCDDLCKFVKMNHHL
ncbi:hypothetical protein E3N88_06729 [Mikania micrantha]|uniref:Uncharacterized protein n=1 Tax=Mikania micrantha TaxID=192012 RepID=A0A5N6PPJ0_9ASTR|nr:hypothetical protein E3N88_06729 [Mikania micrantha]